MTQGLEGLLEPLDRLGALESLNDTGTGGTLGVTG